MKHTKLLSLLLVAVGLLIYEYLAFPIAQNQAEGRSETVVSTCQEKNTWVVLTQSDAGKWKAYTVQKSLLFDRFRILAEQELDTPDFVSECNTALVCYSYSIENGSITIHDPKMHWAFLMPRLLLLLLAWILLSRVLDLIAKRQGKQKNGTV